MQTGRRERRKSSNEERSAALRKLPAVSRLLASRALAGPRRSYGTALITDLLRERLAELRRGVAAGELSGPALRKQVTAAALAAAVQQAAEALLAPRPRVVVNATGVVVHTNLGRSLLSAPAAERVAALARGYNDLEYDLDSGKRGSRLAHLEPLMERLFPGHGFTAVNNNAAAIMLCLRALSRGKEALVSRGELVEIGGSFRVPDIMAASGAKLREVGTTNRTRLSDYASAISPRAGLILKVHTSNFRIVGFSEETSIGALAGLARGSDLPLLVDWGSGELVDLAPLGVRDEIPVTEVLAAGADLVTFSGDKLLGGPQAGFVVGRRDLIARVRKDPLSRVCRLDRLLIAALHRTLAAYVRGVALDEVPTLRMIATTKAEIERRARALKREIERRIGRGGNLALVDGVSRTGGGSSPTGERPTRLLAVRSSSGDAGRMEQWLRGGDPPIISRVRDGRLLLDLRTVLPEQDALLAERVGQALAAESD